MDALLLLFLCILKVELHGEAEIQIITKNTVRRSTFLSLSFHSRLVTCVAHLHEENGAALQILATCVFIPNS